MQAFFAICVMLFVFVMSVVFDSISCTSSWENSGFGYKYTITAGCMISIKNNNTWIPAKNYRAED